MANDQGGSMARFVQHKNSNKSQVPQDGKGVKKSKSAPDFDDLKVPGPARFSRTSKNAAPAANDSAVRAPDVARAASAHDRRAQQVPLNGWETDASEADKTSTTGSILPPHQQRRGHAPEQKYELDQEDRHFGVDFASVEHAHEHEIASGALEQDRDGLPHMTGDSYPATTSGRPSVADAGDMHDRNRAQAPAHQPPVLMPTRGGPGSRNVNVYGANQNMPVAPFAAPTAHQPNLLTAAATGFQFGRGPNSKPEVGRPPPQSATVSQQPAPQHFQPPQNRPSTRTVQQPAVKSNAASGHPTQVSGSIAPVVVPQHEVGPPHSRAAQRQNSPQTVQPPARLQTAHAARPTSQVYKGRSDGFQPNYAPTSDGAYAQGMLESHFHSEQPLPEDDPLDYDPETLLAMKYDHLRKMSIDIDPKAREFADSGVQQATTLPDKLRVVQKLPKERQNDFFKSLDLEQWEDAGDWFLQRFSDLASRFKDARKEKRKAAQAFEEEMEERHLAVSKKMDITQDALKDMRHSGGQVLQGTPKKHKAAPKKTASKK